MKRHRNGGDRQPVKIEYKVPIRIPQRWVKLEDVHDEGVARRRTGMQFHCRQVSGIVGRIAASFRDHRGQSTIRIVTVKKFEVMD